MSKYVMLALAMSLSLSVSAQYSNENESDTGSDSSQSDGHFNYAPQDVIAAALANCKSWAEEGMEPEKLQTFLLNCVNEEIGYQNYSPIYSLPAN